MWKVEPKIGVDITELVREKVKDNELHLNSKKSNK